VKISSLGRPSSLNLFHRLHSLRPPRCGVIASGQAVISEDEGQFQRVSQLLFFGLRFWLSAMISFCASSRADFADATGVAGNDQIQIAGSMMRHTGTLARCRRHHSLAAQQASSAGHPEAQCHRQHHANDLRIGKGISAVSLAGYMSHCRASANGNDNPC